MNELLDTMSVDEFQNWRAYFELHPFGFIRDNMHAAYISAIMANAHRRKNQRPFTPNDFMVKTKEQAKHDTSMETIRAMIKMAKPKKQANG